MDYPITIENACDLDRLSRINDLLHHSWFFENYSKTGAPKFWTNWKRNDIQVLDLWVRLSFKIRKHLKCNLNLLRIQANGQTFNQVSLFHKDNQQDNTWTCVVFTAPEWSVEWGGEFVCFDPHKSEYKYVPYIPNTAVLFPANWDHKGNPPVHQHSELRTSLAFTFERVL